MKRECSNLHFVIIFLSCHRLELTMTFLSVIVPPTATLGCHLQPPWWMLQIVKPISHHRGCAPALPCNLIMDLWWSYRVTLRTVHIVMGNTQNIQKIALHPSPSSWHFTLHSGGNFLTLWRPECGFTLQSRMLSPGLNKVLMESAMRYLLKSSLTSRTKVGK